MQDFDLIDLLDELHRVRLQSSNYVAELGASPSEMLGDVEASRDISYADFDGCCELRLHTLYS